VQEEIIGSNCLFANVLLVDRFPASPIINMPFFQTLFSSLTEIMPTAEGYIKATASGRF